MYKVGDKVLADLNNIEFSDIIVDSKYPYRLVARDSSGDLGLTTVEEDRSRYPTRVVYLWEHEWDYVKPYIEPCIESTEGVLSYDLDLYEYSFVGGHLVVAKKKEIK